MLFISFCAKAQFLEDTKSKETTTKGLDYLYNQQFDLAEDTFASVKKKYPNHPVKFLLNAIQLQWEFIPIDKSPAALKKYISELESCIASAKIVYKDPKYIFFDEATNALDAHNEQVIMQNLEAAFKGKTVVIVAHRLSTVRNADNIIVLEKGEVIEQGSHQELTKKRGAYYQLVREQLELGT